MSLNYGEKAVTPGTPTIYNVSGNVGWVVVQNESPYTLNVSIDGTGSTTSIAAQVIDKIPVPNVGFNGNIILMPSVILSNAANAPSYAVVLVSYGQGEEPTGSYPVALSRAVQVGGNVNAVTSSAQSLQNDAQPANTSLIESTPADAASSTWLADNEGNLTIKGNNAGTLTTLLQLIAGASPAVKLAAAAVLVEALGSMKVDGSLTVLGSASFDNGAVFTNGSGILDVHGRIIANLVNPETGSDFAINVPTGHKIALQNNGTDIADIDGTGLTMSQSITMSNGSINYFSGSIARVGRFTGTGTGTYNHGMGAAPNWVGPIVHTAGSATQGYDSEGTTTVHVTLGASLAFVAYAIR